MWKVDYHNLIWAVTVNSSVIVNSMYISSSLVPDNNVIDASINSVVAQLERDIIAWAKGKFVGK